MSKTKEQERAMKYAESYLDRLLRMEDSIGNKMVQHLKQHDEQAKRLPPSHKNK